MDEYARFAFLYDVVVGGSLRPVHAAMVEIIRARNGIIVADLCCGTGLFAGQARRGGLLPTGVDLSPDMLTIARRNHPSVTFIESDAASTPLVSHSFDAVAISFALHEKPGEVARAILAEARRITRPGGLLVVGDYRVPERGGRVSGLGIVLVERMAGQEHHACFRQYMQAGGTEMFLLEAGLEAELVTTHLNGWAGVFVAQV